MVIAGRSAHAGRNPEDGRNAVLAAADLALRLAKAKGPRLSVNPAKIDGGGPNNVVPDHAVLRVNMRPVTPEDQARAQSHLDAAIAMVAAEHGVHIHCHGGFDLSDSTRTAANETVETPFHNTGLYDVDGFGSYPAIDRGVMRVTGAGVDMGRFRAPSLRNVALTAPYFHDGRAPTLEWIFDNNDDRMGKTNQLSGADRAALVAYLKTL